MKITETKKKKHVEVTIALSKKDKKSALVALKKMRTLFGPEGEHWIQDEENVDDNYCLIGAQHEANGPAELVVELSLVAVIDHRLDESDVETVEIREFLDDSASYSSDWANDVITSYNDADSRKFSQIERILTKAETVIKSGAITLRATHNPNEDEDDEK